MASSAAQEVAAILKMDDAYIFPCVRFVSNK